MLMKKNTLFCFLLLLLALSASAQEEIHFVAGMPAQNGMPANAVNALKLKVEQIIARNNAGATSVHNAFVIQPELVLGETKKTEGLLRDVTLVTGEFSLTARNKYDGSVYGTVAIDVQGDATGSKDAAISSLISSIKVTDPAFVRFIRTTRKRIAEFYASNCPAILQKARGMVAAGTPAEAADYLSALPATAPCYEEATALLAEIGGVLSQGNPLPADPAYGEPGITAPAPEIEPMTDAEPVTAPDPFAAPDPTDAPDPAALPESASHPLADCKISISCSDLSCELVSCEGNETAQSIRLYARFINNGVANNSATIRMTSAIDPAGATFTRFSLVETNGCTSWTYGNKMPKGVRIGKVFEIGGVHTPSDVLAYVEISIDNCKVILRNLPVEWK